MPPLNLIMAHKRSTLSNPRYRLIELILISKMKSNRNRSRVENTFRLTAYSDNGAKTV